MRIIEDSPFIYLDNDVSNYLYLRYFPSTKQKLLQNRVIQQLEDYFKAFCEDTVRTRNNLRLINPPYKKWSIIRSVPFMYYIRQKNKMIVTNN